MNHDWNSTRLDTSLTSLGCFSSTAPRTHRHGPIESNGASTRRRALSTTRKQLHQRMKTTITTTTTRWLAPIRISSSSRSDTQTCSRRITCAWRSTRWTTRSARVDKASGDSSSTLTWDSSRKWTSWPRSSPWQCHQLQRLKTSPKISRVFVWPIHSLSSTGN